MSNIIWRNADGGIAVTTILDGTDPNEHVTQLAADGNFAGWTVLATGYTGTFPSCSQERWQWVGGQITAQAGAANADRRAEVLREIARLEAGTTRALRDMTPADHPAKAKFNAIEADIQPLRVELAQLQGQ